MPLPSSFGGVAALARRPARWLVVWQLSTATLITAVILWSVEMTWWRALRRAADQLPDRAEITGGTLRWTEPRPRILYQDPFVSWVIDPGGRREAGLASDITISLESHQLSVRSLLGRTTFAYPTDHRLEFGRLAVSGWLDAWEAPIRGGLAVVVFGGLLVLWNGLALVHGLVAWLAGRLLNRELGGWSAVRLAGAALLPGAVLMSAAIAFYANHQLSLVGLLIVIPGHLVVGWVFTAGGVLRVPAAGPPGVNPFQPVPPLASPARAESGNPFRTP